MKIKFKKGPDRLMMSSSVFERGTVWFLPLTKGIKLPPRQPALSAELSEIKRIDYRLIEFKGKIVVFGKEVLISGVNNPFTGEGHFFAAKADLQKAELLD